MLIKVVAQAVSTTALSNTKGNDSFECRLLSVGRSHKKWCYLSQNGVRSGIGGSGGRGDEKSTRRAVQTPKCIRARPSPLLSASPSPTEAEVF
eukprot:3748837-Pleurochrysis_carterae.AAC.1